MSTRELVILGSASQVPTRTRNHNGYLLRWDGAGILFDPGEGTQRQMLHAGVSSGAVSRICLTHFHGDHCLGLPGILQRLSLDRVPHRVDVHFPSSGQVYFDRLHGAAIYHDTVDLLAHPVEQNGPIAGGDFGTLLALRLSHPVESYGYRLVEPDGRRMIPERLAAHGITGPRIGQLLRDGGLRVGSDWVDLSEVSQVRRGQRFAFVMDTAMCDGVWQLAEGADLLVIESTFLSGQEDLAAQYGHLTAAQAARVASESGVRSLVLTHFSQRYPDPQVFLDEARKYFDGEIVIAEDLARVPVPPRRP